MIFNYRGDTAEGQKIRRLDWQKTSNKLGGEH